MSRNVLARPVMGTIFLVEQQFGVFEWHLLYYSLQGIPKATLLRCNGTPQLKQVLYKKTFFN